MNESNQNTKSTSKFGGVFETRDPGVEKLRSTSLFRAVNFELYAKPNKFVMGVGLAIFTGCVGYMVYMNLTDDEKSKNYNTINLDGSISSREKTSKWH